VLSVRPTGRFIGLTTAVDEVSGFWLTASAERPERCTRIAAGPMDVSWIGTTRQVPRAGDRSRPLLQPRGVTAVLGARWNGGTGSPKRSSLAIPVAALEHQLRDGN
jgi:hypothetical protein